MRGEAEGESVDCPRPFGKFMAEVRFKHSPSSLLSLFTTIFHSLWCKSIKSLCELQQHDHKVRNGSCNLPAKVTSSTSEKKLPNLTAMTAGHCKIMTPYWQAVYMVALPYVFLTPTSGTDSSLTVSRPGSLSPTETKHVGKRAGNNCSQVRKKQCVQAPWLN